MPLPGDFLFLDESGDLGLAGKSTPVFAVGIIHLKSRDALKRVIKRARRKSLGRRAALNELKWSQSSRKTRMAVLAEVAKEVAHIEGISACVIDKHWMNATFAHRQELVRYNYAVRLALEKGGLFDALSKGRTIHLTIDARNRRATATLTEYLALLAVGNEIPCNIELTAADSAGCAQLQVADFMIGSVYAAYAQQEWEYLNLLRKSGVRLKLRSLRKKTPAP